MSKECTHYFYAGNKTAIDLNQIMLNHLSGTPVVIHSHDELSKGRQLSKKQLENLQNRKTFETGNLASSVCLKKGLHVMFVANTDVEGT